MRMDAAAGGGPAAVAPVVIAGPGAVGTLLGVWCQAAGLAPRYLGRHGHLAVRAGLTLAADRTVTVEAPALAAAERHRVGLILVAVRAGDCAAALAALGDLPAAAPVVVLGNGALEPIVREAAARQPDRSWRLGLVTCGLSRTAPGLWALRSTRGEIAFGPLAPAGAAPVPAERLLLATAVPGGGVSGRWLPDPLPAVRRKWLFNVVINTLCAADRLPANGGLLADLPRLKAVFREALALTGRRLGPLAESPESLWDGLLDLIQATAANENSMARDVRLGRPTEIDWLAGLAVADAEDFPLLAGLVAAVKGSGSA